MNQFLEEIEIILNDYAEHFTPDGTESKAVVHQWVHAIAYGNDFFGKSRGVSKAKIIRVLKK